MRFPVLGRAAVESRRDERFAVIIDSGSSGSRVEVYAWTDHLVALDSANETEQHALPAISAAGEQKKYALPLHS
jgi:Golgi nucleoside diphosphatase